MPPSKRGHRKQTFIRQSFTFMKASKLFSCSALTAFLIGTVANADVVTEWNNAPPDAIRAGHTPPPIASRSLAILHISIYDAVNGIDRTHEPYLVQSSAPSSASREAAASAAAHKALVNLFPAAASSFDALHAATLAGIPKGPQKTAGIVWGEFVANQILAARGNDGSDALVPPPDGSGPGEWVPTPPAFAPYLLPGVTRSFSTCLDAAEEAAVSRLYGGIHFRSANEDGLQAGISIGEWTDSHYLQLKSNHSRR